MAEDWRLKAVLEVAEGSDALDRVITDLHAAEGAGDVAVTHNGGTLFAYAASRADLDGARARVEQVLAADGVPGRIVISHWDDRIADWLQVDPPLEGEAQEAVESTLAAAEQVATRTGVVTAGRLSRETVEQAMLDAARDLGLTCEVSEHRHLLTAQLTFTVTGPSGKVDQFMGALHEEGLVTIRTEAGQFKNL